LTTHLAAFAVSFLLFAPATPTLAQTDADHRAVHQAVLDYVEGFYEGDTTRLIRSVHPDVAKYGFFIPRGATAYSGEAMSWDEFLTYARSVRERNQPAPADAPKDIVVYDVLDQTAAARLTAWWGTDYLLLAKYDGRWMIRMVLWQTPVRGR
jgi:hypothetical protein